MMSIMSQSTFLIWSIACTLILLTTKSFKNQFNQNRICSKIPQIKKKTISNSSIVSIVERTNLLMIDVTNTRIVEMNFAMKIDQMMNFESLDSRKSALYVTSTAVDQSITSKRNEMTRRNVSLIVTLNINFVQSTIVAWSSILLILKTLSMT
jgi:hypothetical protein